MLSLTLVCIGRQKAGAERDLAARYIERATIAGRSLGLAVSVREIDESRAQRPELRKAEEAKAIRASLGASSRIVALDESGESMDSLGFAGLVGAARDAGAAGLALVVGGPDGLDPAFRRAAAHTIAFGAMTWPHQLVRIMAAEQVYRAVTILAGHPYHRG